MPKILFVDDDALMHRLYAPHLERAGYSVISLLTGDQAVEIAARERPSAIIMDMILPAKDGLAATLQLKSTAETKHIPILAISANIAYHAQRSHLQEAGIEAFLGKPFSPAQLLSEIRRLVQVPKSLPSP